MKTLALYFAHPNPLDTPLDEAAYFESYYAFTKRCEEAEITLVVVRGDTYLGNHTFKNFYRFTPITLEKVDQPIKADLIFMKADSIVGSHTMPTHKVINHPELAVTLQDKWLTYQQFSQYMTPTFTIDNNNWKEVVEKISTSRIVLKPRNSYGGKGIFIIEKETLNFPELTITSPYIAQNFVDTSSGIPDVAPGKHDLRVFVSSVESRPTLSFVRMPQGDGVIANLAFGSLLEIVPGENIPAAALKIVDTVEKEFAQYGPRFYCIDFLFEHGTPYIGEINSQPALPLKEIHGADFFERYHRVLLKVAKQALQL
jgi:glutathione synthase/RimK-type ligase-like ATP-grasp enzyme